ncbi:MAG: hypothetical protein AB1642_04980 [Pseudomonadota bacterium]
MNISTSSLQLEIASFRGQTLASLIGALDGNQPASFADVLGNLSADGRNPALRDPESAYRMMSKINGFEVSFKAQYAELSALGDAVGYMEAVGAKLGDDIGLTTANADIIARLQAFVDEYNAWEDRFDHTVEAGGVLDNVQAAEVALFELEQSIRSIFNGAAEGVNGLGALGIEIDPVTRQAVLDVGRLEAMLASNKEGVVSAIDQFSANFAKSADLLNAEGNFIPNALDNRDRAIDYVASNRASLQEEFGTGDAAQPTDDIARALMAYESTFGI